MFAKKISLMINYTTVVHMIKKDEQPYVIRKEYSL